MRSNFADLLVVSYVVYGTVRGRTRGLSHELPRVISVVSSFLLGFGLFRFSQRMLAGLAHMAVHAAGPVSFVGTAAGGFYVMRRIRNRIRDWAATRFADENLQRRGGAAAGFVRALTICAFAVVFISFVPIDFLTRPFTEGSLFGHTVVKVVRPLYELSHGHHTP